MTRAPVPAARLVLALAALLLIGSTVAVEQGPSRVLLLVDCAAAERPFATRQAARWVAEELTRNRADAVTAMVAGFADGVFDVGDRDSIGLRLEQMPDDGKVADFEAAFRHIADRAEHSGLAAAVLIGGASPTVVNGELGLISAGVRADPRYRDITAQLIDLQSAQASSAELIDYLGPFYQERSQALAKEDFARLARSLGDRLLIIDTSGKSAFLKSASEAAGATYLPLPPTETGRPNEPIATAITGLLARADQPVQGPSAVLALGAASALLAAGAALLWRRRRASSRRHRPLPAEAPPDMALRASIPPGRLRVRWRDGDGQPHEDDASSLTPNEIVFRASPGATVDRLEAIVCPHLQVEINVVSCDMILRPDGGVAATLHRLAKGADDRMKVISLLTRLEEL